MPMSTNAGIYETPKMILKLSVFNSQLKSTSGSPEKFQTDLKNVSHYLFFFKEPGVGRRSSELKVAV